MNRSSIKFPDSFVKMRNLKDVPLEQHLKRKFYTSVYDLIIPIRPADANPPLLPTPYSRNIWTLVISF